MSAVLKPDEQDDGLEAAVDRARVCNRTCCRPVSMLMIEVRASAVRLFVSRSVRLNAASVSMRPSILGPWILEQPGQTTASA